MKSATTKHILSFGVTAAMLVGAPGCGMFVEGTINEIPPPDTDAPVDPDATTIVETINDIPPPAIDAPDDPDA